MFYIASYLLVSRSFELDELRLTGVNRSITRFIPEPNKCLSNLPRALTPEAVADFSSGFDSFREGRPRLLSHFSPCL